MVIDKASRDLAATQSTASDLIFEAKSIAGTTSTATKALIDKFNSDVKFNSDRSVELTSFKSRDQQFAMEIASYCQDETIDPKALSTMTNSLVSAQKTIQMQKSNALKQITDYFGQLPGASGDGDLMEIPENMHKGKGKALVEAVELYLRSRISQFWPILPYRNRIITDFDTTKKTFYKPSCIINEIDKVTIEFRANYLAAARFLSVNSSRL